MWPLLHKKIAYDLEALPNIPVDVLTMTKFDRDMTLIDRVPSEILRLENGSQDTRLSSDFR